MTTKSNDWNAQIIEEFRANGGKVGGRFEGAPLLLLHSIGAKSGSLRVNPMMYQQVGDDVAVFASRGGSDINPDWYYNLVATAEAKVEVGTETFDVVAQVTEGTEREEIWSIQKERYPIFAQYEAGTEREIPVLLLKRVQSTS